MKLHFKDFAAGLAVTLFGLLAFVKAFDYGFGTSGRVGPGLFPMLVGALTIVMGMIILVPALTRAGAMPRVDWRPFLAVTAAVAVFAIGLTYLGFVPAVFLCVSVCSLANRGFRPVQTLLLASGATLGFWLLFIVGLALQIPAFGRL